MPVTGISFCVPGKHSADVTAIEALEQMEEDAWWEYIHEQDPERAQRRKDIWEDLQELRLNWPISEGLSGEASCFVCSCLSDGIPPSAVAGVDS